MKWVVGVLLLAVAAILLTAGLFLDRILAAKLPALLTEITGQQVTVGEIEVDLFALRSRATDLNVGDPAHPALYAEAVAIASMAERCSEGSLGCRRLLRHFCAWMLLRGKAVKAVRLSTGR